MSDKVPVRIMLFVCVVGFVAILGGIFFFLDYYYFVAHSKEHEAINGSTLPGTSSNMKVKTNIELPVDRSKAEVPVLRPVEPPTYDLPEGMAIIAPQFKEYDEIRIWTRGPAQGLVCIWKESSLIQADLSVPLRCFQEH